MGPAFEVAGHTGWCPVEPGRALEGVSSVGCTPSPALSWGSGCSLPSPGRLRPSGVRAHCTFAASAHPGQARSPLPSHGTRAPSGSGDPIMVSGSLPVVGTGGHVGGLSPLRCVFLGSTAHPLLSPPWHGLNAHQALGRPTPASPSSRVAPGGLCCRGGLRWQVWSRRAWPRHRQGRARGVRGCLRFPAHRGSCCSLT